MRKKKDVLLLDEETNSTHRLAFVDGSAMMHFAFHSQIAFLKYTSPEFKKDIDAKDICKHPKYGELFKNLFRKKIFAVLEETVPKLYKKAYNQVITPLNIVVVFDCKTQDNWRVQRSISAEYKAGRGARLINKFDIEIFDLLHETVLPEFETHICQKYGRLDYKLIKLQHENAEADDIIGVLTQTIKSVPDERTNILIVTSDSDFAQLHMDRVEIFDINLKTKSNPNIYLRQCEKLDIPDSPNAPKIILLHKVIKGDRSDEVEGIGKVKANNMTHIDTKKKKKRIAFDVKALATDPFKLTQFLHENDEYKKQFDQNRQLVDMSLIPEDIRTHIIKLWKEKKLS
jgi:5'-3' exonuclease